MRFEVLRFADTAAAAAGLSWHRSCARMHVLYVDDDRINLLLFEEACRCAGGVEVSEPPPAAPRRWNWRATGRPQLLVIDLHLPDTDGYQLLPALRCASAGLRRRAGLPVHAPTTARTVRQIAAEAGFDGCWTKPVDSRSLRANSRRSACAAAEPHAARRAGTARTAPPMSFRTEPPFTHGSAARTAVLLVNLGTPDAPTPRGAAPLPGRVPERPARGRDSARCCGG